MKKGFTLIELLVVIAIIGILTSIVLVNLRGHIQGNKYRIITPQDSFYTDFYEEEDGCISFEKSGKNRVVCGEFTITEL